ncbi:MAG: 23S rRNA (guanosine(2251)-2'-O)-methyltransferase RlmB [Clostridia bacterium]|nr:23S rRNA (guanosine(2251)-2'-O)-methyltransferase RlmB [Clostridia bacterium]
MIVEGINVVRELLKADTKIEKIIAEDTDNRDVIGLADLARAKGVCVEIVDKQKLERIAKQKTQGIIAFIPNYNYCEVDDILLNAERKGEKPFIVILDGITDPHNLGAIIRTCECAGVHGIIIPENRACEVNNTVYKTSAGAIVHIPVAMVTNLTRTINGLKKQNIWVYALEAGNKKVYNADFTYPTALVVGSEGKGVSRLVLETVDEVVSLDMFGKVNSLNASNAAAIAVYEVIRQRRK